MIFREIFANLFNLKDACSLVHCISADFALGAGIAKKFNEMGVRQELLKKYPKYHFQYDGCGHSLKIGNVFNLVTKHNYWEKPTYKTLHEALFELKAQLLESNIQKIAMPKIGCELDKLEWTKVEKLIKHVFSNTQIEITVCFIN